MSWRLIAGLSDRAREASARWRNDHRNREFSCAPGHGVAGHGSVSWPPGDTSCVSMSLPKRRPTSCCRSISRIRRAQRDALGVEHVYYFYNEDMPAHFHLWMVPNDTPWMRQFGRSIRIRSTGIGARAREPVEPGRLGGGRTLRGSPSHQPPPLTAPMAVLRWGRGRRRSAERTRPASAPCSSCVTSRMPFSAMTAWNCCRRTARLAATARRASARWAFLGGCQATTGISARSVASPSGPRQRRAKRHIDHTMEQLAVAGHVDDVGPGATIV